MINGFLIDAETEGNDLDIINECLRQAKKHSFHFEYIDDYIVDVVGNTCSASLCGCEYDKALLFIKDNNFCVSLIKNKNVSGRYIEYLKENFNINFLRYDVEVFYNRISGNYYTRDGTKINLDFDDFIKEINNQKFIYKNEQKQNEQKQNEQKQNEQKQNEQNNKENNMQLDNLVQFKIQEKIMDTILKGEELSISKIMMLQSFSGDSFDISDMLKIKLIEKFSLNDDKEKMDYKQIALLNMVQNGKFDFQFFFALNLVDKMIDKDDDFAEIIKLEIINSSKNGFDSNKIMELIIQQKLLSTL